MQDTKKGKKREEDDNEDKGFVSFDPQRFFIRLIKARSSISPLYLHLHEAESTCSTVWHSTFNILRLPPSSDQSLSAATEILHGEMVCYYDNLRFIFFSNGCGNGWGSLGGGGCWGNKRKGMGGGYKKKDWEDSACPSGRLAPSIIGCLQSRAFLERSGCWIPVELRQVLLLVAVDQ